MTFFAISCVFYRVGDWDDLQIDLHVSLHVGFKIQFAGIVPVLLEFNAPHTQHTYLIRLSQHLQRMIGFLTVHTLGLKQNINAFTSTILLYLWHASYSNVPCTGNIHISKRSTFNSSWNKGYYKEVQYFGWNPQILMLYIRNNKSFTKASPRSETLYLLTDRHLAVVGIFCVVVQHGEYLAGLEYPPFPGKVMILVYVWLKSRFSRQNIREAHWCMMKFTYKLVFKSVSYIHHHEGAVTQWMWTSNCNGTSLQDKWIGLSDTALKSKISTRHIIGEPWVVKHRSSQVHRIMIKIFAVYYHDRWLFWLAVQALLRPTLWNQTF